MLRLNTNRVLGNVVNGDGSLVVPKEFKKDGELGMRSNCFNF